MCEILSKTTENSHLDAQAKQLRQQHIQNPYFIDPTPRHVDLMPDNWQGDFLLPIAGERFYQNYHYDGEGYIHKSFVGTLQHLGKYVVNEAYEEPDHAL